MNEELLKLAYQSLKRQFDNISKDSWIWTDFFEDEKVGFDYFKHIGCCENPGDYLKISDPLSRTNSHKNVKLRFP